MCQLILTISDPVMVEEGNAVFPQNALNTFFHGLMQCFKTYDFFFIHFSFVVCDVYSSSIQMDDCITPVLFAFRSGFRLLAHSVFNHPRYAKVLDRLKCPIGGAAVSPVRVVVVDVAARIDVPCVASVATISRAQAHVLRFNSLHP